MQQVYALVFVLDHWSIDFLDWDLLGLLLNWCQSKDPIRFCRVLETKSYLPKALVKKLISYTSFSISLYRLIITGILKTFLKHCRFFEIFCRFQHNITLFAWIDSLIQFFPDQSELLRDIDLKLFLKSHFHLLHHTISLHCPMHPIWVGP